MFGPALKNLSGFPKKSYAVLITNTLLSFLSKVIFGLSSF
jgi:hypothetical protein